MNVQTERIENHKARFTVEVPPDEWEKAKRRAARVLAKRYKIPGFRKGKAPYRIISQYLGEAAIVSDAVEVLGNDVYKQALDESGVDPYTSGSLEDFSEDPPTYTFTVPLQPEVVLNDYRSVRVDYEAPEVDDDTVNRVMRQIQQREAVVEESAQPVTSGNRVTIDIHSEFVDDAPETVESDEASEDDDQANAPQVGDRFIHQDDATVDLDPENEPVLPGFIEALEGSNVDETLEFDLVVPEDDEDYEDIAGRKVHFSVTIKKIESVTIPELTDEFAARITSEEEEPLTLLELRMRQREELQEQAESEAKDTYSMLVLDQMVEQAEIVFPLEMLSDRVHEMLDDMDRELQQQGMNLETYQQVLGITDEQLHEQYEPEADRSLRRSLVLGELMAVERIRVDSDEVDAEMNKMLERFGEQAEMFRQYLDTPQQRSSIGNSVAYGKLMDRIIAIGRDQAPSLDELETNVAEEAETDAETATSDTVDETQTDVEGETDGDAQPAEASEETETES